MNNPNILHAVGEALAEHGTTARPGERMADTVARALHISDAQAEHWLEALDAGSTVEEANARAGILSTDSEPVLVAIAKAIGKALGSITG
ncbi:MAG: hypothetical protein ABJC09_09430 [Terriglobia bacterium]